MTTVVTFRSGAKRRFGVLHDAGVVDVKKAYAALLAKDGNAKGGTHVAARRPVPTDVLAFLQQGEDAKALVKLLLERLEEVRTVPGTIHPLDAVELLPPVTNPPKILCVARNYRQHAQEAGKDLSEIPIIFARFANTLVAPGSNVIVPAVSEQVDWEGELAVIVGRAGRHIRREDALAHVAGYSIFNDVTVRDYQFRVSQYTAGKNFAASAPFGPGLVLAEAVPDPHALRIVTRVNGEVVQDGNTSEMVFDIPAIIEHISEFTGLEVGDVIAMGTPAGVGFTRTPPRFLHHGDVVSVSVDRLGTLTNPVVNEET